MREVDYLVRRAEQETELARRATIPAVVAAHYRLSTAYLDRIEALSDMLESARMSQDA